MRTLVTFLFVTVGAAFGQPSAAPASFEVASVKAAQLVTGGGEGKARFGLRTSPGAVTVQHMPLSAIVRWAYDVKEYQVEGPRWTDNEAYDIFAKAAGPAKDAELRPMMQALLAERFKLAIHREIKELPVYEMTIAKGGHKLKPSTAEGPSNFGPPKGGGGKMAVSAERTSMAQFAELVSQPLQRPVIDNTGLKGAFDFTLDLMSYIPLDADGKPSPDKVAVEDRDTIIIMAVQQQLGLRLEPKKGPIEMLIIDRAEKIPTEN
ncbi:conserved exported hypothetical protein [Candidatus Sulfopaludibacter sp. SbA3]|nr:conserved exported hypothetical protein [Candidatus Sulfopaludibacter sp. SbA3]